MALPLHLDTRAEQSRPRDADRVYSAPSSSRDRQNPYHPVTACSQLPGEVNAICGETLELGSRKDQVSSGWSKAGETVAFGGSATVHFRASSWQSRAVLKTVEGTTKGVDDELRPHDDCVAFRR